MQMETYPVTVNLRHHIINIIWLTALGLAIEAGFD